MDYELRGSAPFNASAEFPQAWKRLKLRPRGSARGNAKKITDERYCVYDAAHGDYIRTSMRGYADPEVCER
jgi:hypothetical protein